MNSDKDFDEKTVPLSPTQRLMYVVSSPVRLVKRQVRPGSVNSSVFNLIICCMGAGTITIPYVFYQNGLILGTFFIFLGGGLSLFTGYLMALCSEYTGGRSYEEIANTLYGEKGLRFTSFCNILCNVGFLISYITLVSVSRNHFLFSSRTSSLIRLRNWGETTFLNILETQNKERECGPQFTVL